MGSNLLRPPALFGVVCGSIIVADAATAAITAYANTGDRAQ